MRVETAPEGEDIACENRSKHEQTKPHEFSGIQGQGGGGTHWIRPLSNLAGGVDLVVVDGFVVAAVLLGAATLRRRTA